jgi:hypothetical protein
MVRHIRDEADRTGEKISAVAQEYLKRGGVPTEKAS